MRNARRRYSILTQSIHVETPVKIEAYVERDKWVMDHIVPTNAIATISTTVFIPFLDVLRLYFPYIGHVTGLVVLVFLALLIMKVLGIPGGKQLQTSIVICSEVCATAFSMGAITNARHTGQGRTIAISAPWVAQLQQALLDIKDSKSDSLRVELKNMGAGWMPGNLLQTSKDGDTKVVELFLKGEMPVTLNDTGNDRQLPSYVVANNYPKAKGQLKPFKENGMDLSDPQLAAFDNTGLSTQPPNLCAVAKDHRHKELALHPVELSVKTDGYPAWQKRKKEVQRKNKGIYPS